MIFTISAIIPALTGHFIIISSQTAFFHHCQTTKVHYRVLGASEFMNGINKDVIMSGTILLPTTVSTYPVD